MKPMTAVTALGAALVACGSSGCLSRPPPAPLPRIEQARVGSRVVLALSARDDRGGVFTLAGFALDTLELVWQLPRRVVEELVAIDDPHQTLWVVHEKLHRQGGVPATMFELHGLTPRGTSPPPREFTRELCPGPPQQVLGGRAILALAPGASVRLFEPSTGQLLIATPPALQAAQCGDLTLSLVGGQLTLLPVSGAIMTPRLRAVATVNLDAALRGGALRFATARPVLQLTGPENGLDLLALSPQARWVATRISGTGQAHLVISDVTSGRRAVDHPLRPGSRVVFADDVTALVTTPEGVLVTDLAHGESSVVGVPGCCQDLVPMLGGRLWWASGAGAGAVLEPSSGRSIAVPVRLGDPVELDAGLWLLEGPAACAAGSYQLRRIAADLSVEAPIPVPLPVTRLLGSAPDRVVLAAECGQTLEIASFAPAGAAWQRRRIPLGKLGLIRAE